MEISQLQQAFLQPRQALQKLRLMLEDRGILYLYGLFIAGYFLLPMASGHRRLYYFLLFPATLLLWRELANFFRGNLLFGLVFAYAGWMMLSMAWSTDFTTAAAVGQFWITVNLLSFVALSGYIWVSFADRIDRLAPRVVWLAGAAALVSILAWYANNPFPAARLEPLGVMHHQNKAGAAYGLFFLLCVTFLLSAKRSGERFLYGMLACLLACLVLLTQSRTALAAVCVGIVVLVGWRSLILVGLGIAISWAILASNPEAWSHRVMAFSFRPGIWQQVLADMSGHWLVGHGYLIDPHVRAYEQIFNHAHNSYLASLRDGGLAGLLLLLGMLGLALHQALQLVQRRGERLYLALLLYGMTCIFMDFDRLLVHPKEMWLFLWLPLALIIATYPRADDAKLPQFPGPRTN